MKSSQKSPEGHNQKIQIPVKIKESLSKIAVRSAVSAAAVGSVLMPAVAEAAPSKAAEKQRLERKLEDRVSSHMPVKFLNGILRIQTEKRPAQTGGAEAFMPSQPPESEAMADDNEVSPLDRYDVSFINRPLYAVGKNGREYVGSFTHESARVDVHLRRYNPDTMSVMSDQTGHGETRNVVFPTSNDVFTTDLHNPMNKLGGKPYLDGGGHPQQIGQELALDMD